jgi:Escherichia/Staphylococcus phage prohead protease
MTTLLYRTFTAALEVREDGDGRTLSGLAIPYGLEIDLGAYTESFVRGAFAGTDPAEVPLTATHPRDGGELPIGITRDLRDEPDGLHGVWYVSDTALGNEVLTLVRDGAVRGLSIGFVPLPDGDRWSRDRSRVERRAALLDHIAVVRSPAYPTARIASVRAAHGPATPRLRLARLLRAA